MTQNSETMLDSVRRGAPTDTIAALAGVACTILATTHPEAFEGLEPAQVAAIMTGAGSVLAMIRAAFRARRRRRRQRRKARRDV